MYPITSILAAVANRASIGELARFAGRHIALRLGQRQLVWRIADSGGFVAASPLIDADCRITYKNGGVHLSGSGELLTVLSGLLRETDWLAVISQLFGSRLAPVVLHQLERGADAIKQRTVDILISPAVATAAGDEISDFCSRVQQAERRLEKLTARTTEQGA